MPPEVVGQRPCDFCRTGDHELCPDGIPDAAGARGSVWYCPCSYAGHNAGSTP